MMNRWVYHSDFKNSFGVMRSEPQIVQPLKPGCYRVMQSESQICSADLPIKPTNVIFGCMSCVQARSRPRTVMPAYMNYVRDGQMDVTWPGVLAFGEIGVSNHLPLVGSSRLLAGAMSFTFSTKGRWPGVKMSCT